MQPSLQNCSSSPRFLNQLEGSISGLNFDNTQLPSHNGYDSPKFDSSSMSESSRSSFFSSRNSSRMSLDSQNTPYMRLETQLHEYRQHIQLLEQQNQRLTQDTDVLSAQVNALQSSFVALSNSLQHARPGQGAHIAITSDNVDKVLNPADFEQVKFWTRAKWSLSIQAEKGITKLGVSPSTRGSSRLARGENVACQYIEDANGVAVDGHRAKAMRGVFFTYLHQLKQADGKLPSSWSQFALDLKQGFYHAIRTNFVEFRYCADNWKADYLAMQNYPQWFKYHIGPGTPHSSTSDKKRSRSTLPAPQEDNSVHSSSSGTKKQKIKSISLNDTELEYVDLNIATNGYRQRQPPPTHTPDSDPNPSDLECITHSNAALNMPASTNKDGSSYLVVPEIRNPLQKSGAAALAGPFRMPVDNVTSPATIPTASFSTIAPPTPVLDRSECVATPKPRARLVNSFKPASTKVPTVAKGKGMRIQKTINARNLCAAAWKVAGNLLGTAKQFKLHWEQLPVAEKAVFESQAKLMLAASVSTTKPTGSASAMMGHGEEDFASEDEASAVSGLSAGMYGVLKSHPPGPLFLYSVINSGIASATFFSIREYLVGPVLILGKPYELRKQRSQETDASRLTWGDIRARKVIDSSISGGLTGGILNTWKRGKLGTAPGFSTGAIMCGLLQWAFNEFDILRITYISRVAHSRPLPAAIPAKPTQPIEHHPPSLPLATPELPRSLTDRIFSMLGHKISDEEYLDRMKSQRNNHLCRIEQLERNERDEKRQA